jgi:hypothetical protein
MAGTGVRQPPCRRIDERHQEGHEAVLADVFDEEAVGHPHRDADVGLRPQQGPHVRPGRGGDERRGEAVPTGIADDESGAAVVEAEEIVEITAGGVGGIRSRRHREARQVVWDPRQHRLLDEPGKCRFSFPFPPLRNVDHRRDDILSGRRGHGAEPDLDRELPSVAIHRADLPASPHDPRRHVPEERLHVAPMIGAEARGDESLDRAPYELVGGEAEDCGGRLIGGDDSPAGVGDEHRHRRRIDPAPRADGGWVPGARRRMPRGGDVAQTRASVCRCGGDRGRLAAPSRYTPLHRGDRRQRQTPQSVGAGAGGDRWRRHRLDPAPPAFRTGGTVAAAGGRSENHQARQEGEPEDDPKAEWHEVRAAGRGCPGPGVQLRSTHPDRWGTLLGLVATRAFPAARLESTGPHPGQGSQSPRDQVRW